MNPSPQAVEAIRSRVADWGPDDATVAASLNAPAVDNPSPRATVLKPFSFVDVMGMLSDATVAAIRDTPNTTDLIDKVNGMDRPGVAHWVAALLKPPAKMTPAEAQSVMAVVTATEPDPSWPAQISWAVANLGRPVDSEDVAAARQGA